jgi:hypothetical protein
MNGGVKPAGRAGTQRDLHQSEGSLEAAARFAAAEPGWMDRVFAAHVRGEDGRCAGCATQAGPSVRWPCVMVYIATRAHEINSGR